MPPWVNEGVHEYQKRLAGDVRLEIIELPLPKRGSTDAAVLRKKVAALINKQLERWPQALRIAVEGKGKRKDTDSLSRSIDAARNIGQDMIVLIGGPDGLWPQISGDCPASWSL